MLKQTGIGPTSEVEGNGNGVEPGRRPALHTLGDCVAVRPTRERLDCGGFSTPFVRAHVSRMIVNASCGRKRRRRCALPAQSMTLVGGRSKVRNPSPRNPKEIRRPTRIFEQQRRQDTKLFTRISREGFRRPYVTLGAGVAAARPLPPCPARIRATEGSTRESCQYSSHQASTRTTRYKVARPPSRARAWLFGAAPDGTAGMKQKIPGTTSSIGEFRKRGQSIERIRLKDLCGQKATIKNTTKSVQPLNKNLL